MAELQLIANSQPVKGRGRRHSKLAVMITLGLEAEQRLHHHLEFVIIDAQSLDVRIRMSTCILATRGHMQNLQHRLGLWGKGPLVAPPIRGVGVDLEGLFAAINQLEDLYEEIADLSVVEEEQYVGSIMTNRFTHLKVIRKVLKDYQIEKARGT